MTLHPVPAHDYAPSSFDVVQQAADLAERIARTDFVPGSLRNRPDAILAAILYGHEAGIGPMESLAKIHVVDGRPGFAAELMRAQILRHGHRIWVDDLTDTRVTVCGQRRGDDIVHRVTWTMDNARKAGLAGRQGWQKYPRQMLTARATTELARLAFADVLGSARYSVEELNDGDDMMDVAARGLPADDPQSPGKATRRRRKPPVDEPATPTGGSAGGAMAPADVAAGPVDDDAAPAGPARPPLPDEPLSDDGPEPARLTDAQRRKLHAVCRDVGLEDRSDRLALAAGLFGRQLHSAADLTVPEASRLIDALQAVADGRARMVRDEDGRPVDVVEQPTVEPGA